MSMALRAERWRALDPPELLPVLEELDNLVPFFSKQDMAIMHAMLSSFCEEIARPMVRAASLAEAERFFGENLSAVADLFVGLNQLVGARILAARGWSRQQLVDAARRVADAPQPWLGRMHQQILSATIDRIRWTVGLVHDVLAAVELTRDPGTLLEALVGRPSYARYVSTCITSEGIALVCRSAIFDDEEVPTRRELVANLRGLVTHAWHAAWGRCLACAIWVLEAEALIEAHGGRLSPSAHDEASSLADDEREFRILSDEWNRATAHLADAHRAQEHPAWGAAVALGTRVIPFMLAEMRDPTRRSWASALRAITGESPSLAPGDRGDHDKLAAAWQRLVELRGWVVELDDARPRS